MEVFGNNVKNEHNYSFEDANRYFLNTSNNYFKILKYSKHLGNSRFESSFFLRFEIYGLSLKFI